MSGQYDSQGHYLSISSYWIMTSTIWHHHANIRGKPELMGTNENDYVWVTYIHKQIPTNEERQSI